ncbi:MAG TPA: Calx-beta domain-containing protein [Thermoanaerobaculia bacterium]|nr:Calx-beta domain-containing protein [Thermoanaerobaculia bacterium]
MSKNDTRLILSLVGLLLAAPLTAQIGLEASTDDLPVTETLSLAAFPPRDCPTKSADDWSIDPGVDGSVISEEYFGEFIEWEITWTSGGTKSILVSIDNCPETGETDIDVNTCQFSSNTYQALEELGYVQLQVERVGGTGGNLSCDLQVIGGTATDGEDFTFDGAAFLWIDGDGEPQDQAIEVIDDSLVEPTETIELELRPLPFQEQALGRTPSAVRTPTPGVIMSDFATIEILDDEITPATFSFVEAASQALETDGVATIGVRRAAGSEGVVSVEVEVAGGTAEPADFSVASPLVLSWSDGEDGVKEFEVELVADEDEEPDENVLFRLTDPQGPPSSPPTIVEPQQHTLTILDVTPPEPGVLRFTASSFSGSEGEEGIAVGVERQGSSDGAASVDVCFGDGSISLEDLLLPASTTLEWADGETGVRTLDFGIVDDVQIEGTESLPLELCELVGDATLGEPDEAALVLLDNDFETSEEILVAGPATGPEDPIVVYDRAGRKIVVWVASDEDGFGVFAQLFDEDGEPLGDVFRVNQDTAGDSTQPSAILRDDGTIVIVWRQSPVDGLRFTGGRVASPAGGGTSVVSRGFDPSQGTSTGETVVSSSETGDGSQNPEVGADRDGEITVTWEDAGQVRGQVLSPDLEPQTPVIDISELAGAQDPEVAVAASGDFVVVWTQAEGGSGEGQGTILVRSFNDRGAPRGEIEVVSDDPQADSPAVAIDDQGNFFVVFSQPGDEGIDVYGRLFDRRGRRRGPLIRLNSNVTGDQTSPRVDMNSIGDIAVVWESSPAGAPGAVSGGGTSIVSRFFTPQGEAQSGDVEVAESEAASTPQDPDVSIEDEDEVTVVFERRGPGNESEGIFSTVIDPTLVSGPCFGDATTLCVRAADRFRILVEWQDFEGNSGEGQALPLTDDTGYFWFFGPDNVEILIKVLDGCAINDRLWVFAGGLTNVEVNLRVDDVAAGITRSYFNSLGRSFEPIIDINAFDTCDASLPTPPGLPAALGDPLGNPSTAIEGWTSALSTGRPELREATATGAECAGGEQALCLRDGRFEATLLWESADSAGAATPVPLTDESGTFWFFEPDNVEAVVKVLDACGINGHFWVFAAGITDLETDLQVLDTATSTSRQYTNERGTPFAPVLDTQAFECQ